MLADAPALCIGAAAAQALAVAIPFLIAVAGAGFEGDAAAGLGEALAVLADGAVADDAFEILVGHVAAGAKGEGAVVDGDAFATDAHGVAIGELGFGLFFAGKSSAARGFGMEFWCIGRDGAHGAIGQRAGGEEEGGEQDEAAHGVILVGSGSLYIVRLGIWHNLLLWNLANAGLLGKRFVRFEGYLKT